MLYALAMGACSMIYAVTLGQAILYAYRIGPSHTKVRCRRSLGWCHKRILHGACMLQRLGRRSLAWRPVSALSHLIQNVTWGGSNRSQTRKVGCISASCDAKLAHNNTLCGSVQYLCRMSQDLSTG